MLSLSPHWQTYGCTQRCALIWIFIPFPVLQRVFFPFFYPLDEYESIHASDRPITLSPCLQFQVLETWTQNAWRRFATFAGWNCHFRHDDFIVLRAWHDESLRSLLLSAWSRMCLFPIPAPGDPSGNAYVGPEDCLNWPTMLEHTDKTAALAGANASACPQTVWGHMFCPHEGNMLEMIPVKSLCCQSQQAPLSWYTRFTLGTFFAFILEVFFMFIRISECSGSSWG